MKLRFTIPIFLLLGGATFVSACGTGTSSIDPNSKCQAMTATVEVGTGYLRTRCGCQEGDLVTTPAGKTFHCTVAAGSTLFFSFTGSTTEHQILSTSNQSGGSSFAPSPLWTPKSPLGSYAVVFATSGIYPFADAFESDLSGSIIVP